MTEKRFTLTTTGFDGTLSFYDAEYDCETRMSTEYVLNSVETTLNELHEENQRLKQFKEDVLNKIDMHLRMLPTARDREFNDEYGDPDLYTGAIYMLETLKKEL